MPAGRNSSAWGPRALPPRAARTAALAATVLCLGLTPACADGLTGRIVQFNIITYDDPATPYLTSRDYVAKVGEGPEFGMVREGFSGLDVVPVLIDVGANRIDFTYPGQSPGAFSTAAFNGYVLRFPTTCTLIAGAAVDPATTLPLTSKSLTLTPQSLMINVSGLAFDAKSRISLTLDVLDCPLS
jgi:hypothetical protein